MPRRNLLQVIIDNVKEALQALPIRKAFGESDKRSSNKSRRLTEELKQYKPSEVAREMGISTQKYTTLRRQVEEGKVSSSSLNDTLEQVSETLKETSEKTKEIAGYPHEEEDEYITEAPVRGKRKFKIDYAIASEDFVNKKMKWAAPIKRGMSRQSALNWFGNVTGGKEYFWIVKDDNGRYSIYDVRTAAERGASKKGTVSGNTKATALYDEYSEMWEEKNPTRKPRRRKNAGKDKSGSKSKRAGGRQSKSKGGAKRGRAKTGRPVETRKSSKASKSRKHR